MTRKRKTYAAEFVRNTKWRLMIEKGRKAGHTFGEPDLLIAATALHHGLTVVSRNNSEYEAANVLVSNPWRA